MKKSKIILTTLLSGALGLSLASCGGEKGTSSNEILFYSSAGNTLAPIIEKEIKEFNKTSDIKVKLANPGDYDVLKEKVKSDLKVNNQPAIAYCYPDHVAEYLDGTYKNKVIDLKSRFIDGDTEFANIDFVDSYYNEGKLFDENKLYTLPFQRSTEVMYVNMTHIKEAEVDVKDLATWEDLFGKALPKLNAAQKAGKLSPTTAKDDKGNAIPMEYKKTLGYDSDDNLFITLTQQYGLPYTANGSTSAERYLFNNDKNAKMIQSLNQQYLDGNFTTKTILGGYTSNEFVRANLSISIGSTGGASHQDPKNGFEYDVLRLPYAKGKEESKISISQGPSLVMFEQSSDAKENAAWEFVKRLFTDTFQAEYSSKSGYLPVTNSAYETEAFQNFLATPSIISKTIKVASENKDSLFTTPAFNGSNEARQQVGIALAEGAGKKDTLITIDACKKLLKEAYDMCTYWD